MVGKVGFAPTYHGEPLLSPNCSLVAFEKLCLDFFRLLPDMVRVGGIEPPSSAWKAGIIAFILHSHVVGKS